MDNVQTDLTSGSLQISKDALAEIAKKAALEVDGVQFLTKNTTGVRQVLQKMTIGEPVYVDLTAEGVAMVNVILAIKFGAKIPEVSEKVQENVKNSIQNMSGIAVTRVNIIVGGIYSEDTTTEE